MKKLFLKDIAKYRLEGAPLFLTKMRAGFQNIAEDDIEKRISLDKEFNIKNPSTFVFSVSGDSMINLGIYEGDLVVVKKTTEVESGDIVIANVDGAYTIKTYKNKEGKIWLEAANPSYKEIRPKFKLEIFGKVTGVVRKID